MVKNELLIESKPDKYNLKAKVYANTKKRKIVISNWANHFTEEKLLPLKNWLEDYLKNNEELLTIEFDAVFNSLPFIEPKENNFFIQEYLQKHLENSLTKIIQTIPKFHFLIDGQGKPNVGYASGGFPTIKGNIETGVIEIYEEMYNSYALEFMYSFFCWLELLFKQNVSQIHIYSKISYICTSYMRRMAETATALSSWSEKTGKNALWTWYYLEDDEDMKEWFNDIFNKSKNLAYLKTEVIELDEKQWKKLLK